MSAMKRALGAEHKLKHWGRLQVGLMLFSFIVNNALCQYGLFLKGIGLSLEEALVYWKAEFTKVMTDKVCVEMMMMMMMMMMCVQRFVTYAKR